MHEQELIAGAHKTHKKSGGSSSVTGASVSRHLRHAGASVLDATGGVSAVPVVSPAFTARVSLGASVFCGDTLWRQCPGGQPCVSECLSWASPRAPPLTSSAPLTRAANCDAAAICTLGCGCELIVMGPSASISLVIGRWVRPRGAKSPVPAFRRCLSPRLLVTAVITFTHHIRHHLLLERFPYRYCPSGGGRAGLSDYYRVSNRL